MHSRLLVGAVALTFVTTAQLASAQGQGRARGRAVPYRFEQMDINHDGVVTRKEWTGTAASFKAHDWNNDKILSGTELRLGPSEANSSNDGRGRGAGDFDSPYREYDFDDWTASGFTGLDHNRDNRITRDEWHFSLDSFQLADHDRNGSLSRAEFLSEDSIDDDRDDHFRNLDANNDGRISRSEWHGAMLLFNALDKNRDGDIARAEMVGTEPPPDLFTSIDVNGDGNITVPEWHWSRASFDQRDANKDGRLSQTEFRGAVAPSTGGGAYKAGYDRGVTEGHAAGREDRVRNQGWDLEGQRELETADSGYQPSMGPRESYQTGYREGFRKAYREGWTNPNTQ